MPVIDDESSDATDILGGGDEGPATLPRAPGVKGSANVDSDDPFADLSSEGDRIMTRKAQRERAERLEAQRAAAADASHSPDPQEISESDGAESSDDDDVVTRRRNARVVNKKAPPPVPKAAGRRGRRPVVEQSSEETEDDDTDGGSGDDEEYEESDEGDDDATTVTSDDPRAQRRAAAAVAASDDRPNPGRPKKIEAILGHRADPEGDYDFEYLLKYEGYSYHHVEWKVEPEVHAMWSGAGQFNKRLVTYQTKHMNNAVATPRVRPKTPQKKTDGDVSMSQDHGYAEQGIEEQFFDPNFKLPERIVAVDRDRRGTEYYLIKWVNLTYDQCTWETAAFLRSTIDTDGALLKKFYAFQNPPAQKVNYTRAVPVPTLGRMLQAVRHRSDSLRVYANGNKLRDYQEEGVAWLLYNWFSQVNCILGDEMGLGKTVQVLSFCDAMRDLRQIPGPFMIIAPLATLGHWTREATQWMPKMNAITYFGNEKARDRIFMNEMFFNPPAHPGARPRTGVKFHVLVTTYEWALRDINRFNRVHWAGIIIDEGHRMKNEDASLFKALSPLKTEFRCVLTGTPVQNHIGELYAVLKYLEKSTVDRTQDEFMERMTPMTQEKMDDLFKVLGPRLLRREKNNVEKSIPPKIEILVKVALTAHQREVYRETIEANRGVLTEKGGTKVQRATRNKNICMDLRKVCNHPWLIEGGEARTLESLGYANRTAPQDVVMEALVRSSAKMMFLDKLLAKFRAEGEKVLIFSQFVTTLHIIHDFLTWRGYPFETITGETQGHLRQSAVDRYMDPKRDSFVFMISTRAGGTGINLTAASKVVIYDSDWNPQNDLQAQARCHRIGQKREVEVYRVLTENTYEERMFEVASQKLGLDHVILHSAAKTKGAAPTNSAMGLSSEEIERVLKHGAYDLYNKDGREDEDAAREAEGIEAILERSKKIVTGVNEAEKAKEAGDGGGGDDTGPAVRGLAAFSKVNFKVEGEGLDDPDFWSKILPEEINIATLEKRLNGAAPPATSEDVHRFLDDLNEAITKQLAEFGPKQALISTDFVRKQEVMEALVLQAKEMEVFKTAEDGVLRRVDEALARAVEPRLRKRQVRKRGLFAGDDDDDAAMQGMYVAEMEAAKRASLAEAKAHDPGVVMRRARRGLFRPWRPTALRVYFTASRKVGGYGRWGALVDVLREKRAYPAADLLPLAVREGLLASVFESAVSYFLGAPAEMYTKKDRGVAAGKQQQQQQQQGKKKKKKKQAAKKKRSRKHRDDDSSSGWSSDSSDEFSDSSSSSSGGATSDAGSASAGGGVKGYHPLRREDADDASTWEALQLGQVAVGSNRETLGRDLKPLLAVMADYRTAEAAVCLAAKNFVLADPAHAEDAGADAALPALLPFALHVGHVDPESLDLLYTPAAAGEGDTTRSTEDTHAAHAPPQRVRATAGTPVKIVLNAAAVLAAAAPGGDGDVPMPPATPQSQPQQQPQKKRCPQCNKSFMSASGTSTLCPICRMDASATAAAPATPQSEATPRKPSGPSVKALVLVMQRGRLWRTAVVDTARMNGSIEMVLPAHVERVTKAGSASASLSPVPADAPEEQSAAPVTASWEAEYDIACVRLTAGGSSSDAVTLTSAAADVERVVKALSHTEKGGAGKAGRAHVLPIAVHAPQPWLTHLPKEDITHIATALAGAKTPTWTTLVGWNMYIMANPTALDEGTVDIASIPDESKRLVEVLHANGGVLPASEKDITGGGRGTPSPPPGQEVRVVRLAPDEFYMDVYRESLRAYALKGLPPGQRVTDHLARWRQDILEAGVRGYLEGAGLLRNSAAAAAASPTIALDTESKRCYRVLLQRVRAAGLAVCPPSSTPGAADADAGATAPTPPAGPDPPEGGDGVTTTGPYPPPRPLTLDTTALAASRGLSPATPHVAACLKAIPSVLSDFSAIPPQLLAFVGSRCIDDAVIAFNKSICVSGGLRTLLAEVEKDCGTLVPAQKAADTPKDNAATAAKDKDPAGAATNPSQHLKVRGLVKTVKGVLADEATGKKRSSAFWPEWWDALCYYDLCRGVARHALSVGDILWDPELCFYARVDAKATPAEREAAEAPGKDKPVVQIAPQFAKKVQRIIDILASIFAGDVPLKVVTSAKAKQATADKEMKEKLEKSKKAIEDAEKAKKAKEEKARELKEKQQREKEEKKQERLRLQEEKRAAKQKEKEEKQREREEKKAAASAAKKAKASAAKSKATAPDRPAPADVIIDDDGDDGTAAKPQVAAGKATAADAPLIVLSSQDTEVSGPPPVGTSPSAVAGTKRTAEDVDGGEDAAKRVKPSSSGGGADAGAESNDPIPGSKRSASDVVDADADAAAAKRAKPSPPPIVPPQRPQKIKEKKQASLTAFFGKPPAAAAAGPAVGDAAAVKTPPKPATADGGDVDVDMSTPGTEQQHTKAAGVAAVTPSAASVVFDTPTPERRQQTAVDTQGESEETEGTPKQTALGGAQAPP